MRHLSLKLYVFAVIISFNIAGLSAQNMCERLITPKIASIESELSSFKADQASGTAGDSSSAALDKIAKDIDHVASRIKSCELKGRMSLDALKERLASVKEEHGLLSGNPIANKQANPNLTETNQIIMKMETVVTKHGEYCMEEKYKGLTRQEVAFIQNYKDDNSSYYKSDIMRAQLYLRSLEENINKSYWVENAKTTIDDKARSINGELEQAYMNCFYNDLSYVYDVALPNNENLQTILAYLEQFQ